MTGKQLTNPLSSIISKAKKLPTTTGETQRFAERLENHSGTVVVLADVSGSMSERAGAARKIDILRESLAATLPGISGAKLLAFSAVAREVSPETLPEPAGGTALHLAIEAARHLRPAKTIVVSDGRPDDKIAALAAAKLLTGTIDVIYCGPDSDHDAIAFMRTLAKVGLGTVVMQPLSAGPTAISQQIKRLAITGPRS